MRRANDWLFALSAAVVVALSALRVSVFGQNEAYLDYVSGTWTALAKDLTESVLYRPLYGPAGYGGSRYFPLQFVIHAGVMKVFGRPIGTGLAESALAMLLLLAGVYVLLRAVGASRTLAASCAAFVLAAQPAQEALLTIKGDGLAAAFNVLGVAVSAAAAGAAGIWAPALLFTLAFATKVTAVSGVAAVVLWRWLKGERATAVSLAAATIVGMAAVLVAIQLGSHGVAFSVLRASASGGATFGDLLRAPISLAKQVRRVPETLAFVQLGCAAFLVLLFRPKPLLNLPLIFFASVFAVTTVIFGSPGTDTNHLLDLHVASIVLMASWLIVRETPTFDVAAAALVVAALAASLSLASGLANARTEQRRGRFADALKLIPDQSRPILAQNPLVPIAAGQRPYLIDPFMFRVLSVRDPAFAEPMLEDLRNRRFAAVVLETDPRNERAEALYRSAILGGRVLEAVTRDYEIVGMVGTRTILLPRALSADPGEPREPREPRESRDP